MALLDVGDAIGDQMALLDVGDAIGDQILHQVLDGLRVLPFCFRLRWCCKYQAAGATSGSTRSRTTKPT
jgi:hypothetical protein